MVKHWESTMLWVRSAAFTGFPSFLSHQKAMEKPCVNGGYCQFTRGYLVRWSFANQNLSSRSGLVKATNSWCMLQAVSMPVRFEFLKAKGQEHCLSWGLSKNWVLNMWKEMRFKHVWNNYGETWGVKPAATATDSWAKPKRLCCGCAAGSIFLIWARS